MVSLSNSFRIIVSLFSPLERAKYAFASCTPTHLVSCNTDTRASAVLISTILLLIIYSRFSGTVVFVRALWINETTRSSSLSISDSQKRNTVQPCFWSAAEFFLSWPMFLSILAVQYSGFEPHINFFFRAFQSRPCQKSPSQNIATRALLMTMSGLPGRLTTFLLYRIPVFQSALLSLSSGLVSLFRLAPFAASDARLEAGIKPL